MKYLIAAAGLAAVVSSPAMAATRQQYSAFARDRNVSVSERAHPEYAPLNIRWESLVIQPELDVSLEGSDNIYATETNTKSDFDLKIKPQVTLTSDWSRNEFGAYVRGSYDNYFTYTSENAPQAGVGAHFRLDTLPNSSVTLTGEYSNNVESRESTNYAQNLAKPLRNESFQAALNSVTEINRFRYSLSAGGEVLTYQSGKLKSGGSFDVSGYNRSWATVDGEVEYAINPGTAVYSYIGLNERAYDHNDPGQSRNSKGFDVALGTNFDITRLVRGDVRIGYLEQYYVAKVPAVGGLSLRATVEYFPTQLTTIKLQAVRAVQDTDQPDASSYVTEYISGRIDHELFRNIILSASIEGGQDTYNGICGTPGCTYGRHDDRWDTTFGVNYLMNRRVGLNLAFTHENLTSSGPNRTLGHSSNMLLLTTVLRY
ncbi:MAG: outer membrane beta-barrel protein [Caulobacteraceae bacterium]|nr:outer membrane beta-barrel protein [Caulobacteraceae bacterium]